MASSSPFVLFQSSLVRDPQEKIVFLQSCHLISEVGEAFAFPKAGEHLPHWRVCDHGPEIVLNHTTNPEELVLLEFIATISILRDLHDGPLDPNLAPLSDDKPYTYWYFGIFCPLSPQLLVSNFSAQASMVVNMISAVSSPIGLTAGDRLNSSVNVSKIPAIAAQLQFPSHQLLPFIGEVCKRKRSHMRYPNLRDDTCQGTSQKSMKVCRVMNLEPVALETVRKTFRMPWTFSSVTSSSCSSEYLV